MRHILSGVLAGLMLVAVAPALAQQVGEVGVDWLGNDIIVEAVKDPEVEGVTCHVSYFDRGVIDRLQKGNWFEDPSDSAISCRQTGPIKIGEIDMGESMTMAPFVAKDKVIGEISGGEYGVRGWIEALDANTGKSVRNAYSTGPGFKPFYDSEMGKDLGVTARPPSAW